MTRSKGVQIPLDVDESIDALLRWVRTEGERAPAEELDGALFALDTVERIRRYGFYGETMRLLQDVHSSGAIDVHEVSRCITSEGETETVHVSSFPVAVGEFGPDGKFAPPRRVQIEPHAVAQALHRHLHNAGFGNRRRSALLRDGETDSDENRKQRARYRRDVAPRDPEASLKAAVPADPTGYFGPTVLRTAKGESGQQPAAETTPGTAAPGEYSQQREERDGSRQSVAGRGSSPRDARTGSDRVVVDSHGQAPGVASRPSPARSPKRHGGVSRGESRGTAPARGPETGPSARSKRPRSKAG